MRIPINEIKLNPGRREAEPEDIKNLADSIAELGLLNPITINQGHTLIAGRHRLEAAKLLGWAEIECTVTDLQGLQAELAEIDENFVRKNLPIICVHLARWKRDLAKLPNPDFPQRHCKEQPAEYPPA